MPKKSEQIAKILRETSTMKEAREKMIEEGLATTHAQARRHIKFLVDTTLSAFVDTLKLEAGLRISNRDEPGA